MLRLYLVVVVQKQAFTAAKLSFSFDEPGKTANPGLRLVEVGKEGSLDALSCVSESRWAVDGLSRREQLLLMKKQGILDF